MSLTDKTLHELRAIAQGYGVTNLFGKDAKHLIQEIQLHQESMAPETRIVIERPAYDARLMTKAPSRKTSQQEITELLQPYVERGLHLSFPNEEEWHMRFGDREDTGTVRQPLRQILRCAEGVFQ